MKVLVTAGPTREPLDPVRFLTNRSSGKMGYALAGAFAHEGHSVMLISGPTQLDIPANVDFILVGSAAEMYAAVASYLPKMEIAVFAAAVADYTPATIAPQKIKKHGETLTLELIRTADILGSARVAMGFQGTLIGFAAETENIEANGREKLVKKQCDMIVANDVSKPHIGFDSDENEVLLVFPDLTIPLPAASKQVLAMDIVEAVMKLHLAK